MIRQHDRLAASVLAAVTLVGAITAAFAATSAEPKRHTILIKGFAFEPARLEVAPGDTVIWKNEDIVPHTATATKGFDSKNLDQGESWSFVAGPKGAFPYICTYHPTMAGELVVK